MSARRNLKLVTLASLLLLVGACSNEKNSSRKAAQQNPVCEGISCLDSVTWKILLQGHMFPDKTRVEINGLTVLDECMSKQQYKIDRAAAPQSLTLENYIVPKRGHVKIHIVDQGWDCQKETAFLVNDNVSYDVVKGVVGSEVHINL